MVYNYKYKVLVWIKLKLNLSLKWVWLMNDINDTCIWLEGQNFRSHIYIEKNSANTKTLPWNLRCVSFCVMR